MVVLGKTDPLDANETQFLAHMTRWGSDGYPLLKVRGGWIWQDAFAIKGAPVVYKTKREATAAIERYLASLLDRKAGRVWVDR